MYNIDFKVVQNYPQITFQNEICFPPTKLERFFISGF